MIPAIANNYTPVQTPIINTALPGSTIAHVPYDNVAPSISSAQVGNNASPNTVIATEENPPAPAPIETSDAQQAATLQNASIQTAASGAQATFLAQLISQDGSPATQTILVQYEKLVALGNVKYKPSNASKPLLEPASSFGQILHESAPAAPPVPVQPAPVAQQQPAPQPQAAAVETVETAPVPQPQPSPINLAPPPASNDNNAPRSPAPQVTSAYNDTATRVATQSQKNTTELA